MKKIVVLIALLLLPISKINAFYCTNSEMTRYKRLASNINYSYDYIEQNDDVTFKITLVNLNSEVYLVDSNGKYYYQDNEIVIDALDGQNISFKVYPRNNYCDTELLYTINITLPTYNKYYNDEICKDIQNYKLCQRWANINLNYEEFTKKVNEYKQSLIKEEPIVEEEKVEESLLDYIIYYFAKYYYVILIAIIVFASIGIYKSSKKDNIYS